MVCLFKLRNLHRYYNQTQRELVPSDYPKVFGSKNLVSLIDNSNLDRDRFILQVQMASEMLALPLLKSPHQMED
jgi:hypothetical protein